MPSTAAVSRRIGRVNVLAMNTANAAAHNTAINPTVMELRKYAGRRPQLKCGASRLPPQWCLVRNLTAFDCIAISVAANQRAVLISAVNSAVVCPARCIGRDAMHRLARLNGRTIFPFTIRSVTLQVTQDHRAPAFPAGEPYAFDAAFDQSSLADAAPGGIGGAVPSLGSIELVKKAVLTFSDRRSERHFSNSVGAT
jgi:hypothetical protein